MARAYRLAVIVWAAAVMFAAPALAAPCDGDAFAGLDYALEQVTPGAPSLIFDLPGFSPGSACSSDSECDTGSGEKCEGGSCCVKSGQSCTGLGYCCGHPSQGCVNGTCP